MKLLEILAKTPSIIITVSGCPHCLVAMRTLRDKKVNFTEIKGMENKDVVEEVKQKEGHKTFPMIYIDGKFIGGNDKLQEYFKSEEKENAM